MNKAQLTKALAARGGMKKKDAEKAVDLVFDVITEALVKNEKVQISGFGSFETKARAERTGRNPHTHEEILIPAHRNVSFSPGKTLKGIINSKG